MSLDMQPELERKPLVCQLCGYDEPEGWLLYHMTVEKERFVSHEREGTTMIFSWPKSVSIEALPHEPDIVVCPMCNGEFDVNWEEWDYDLG